MDDASSPGSRRGASSQEDEEEPCAKSAKVESDASLASGVDSGTGSDEFDSSELGEPGTLLCQVGIQSCGIPLELFHLPDLGSVLSLETWNDCLSEQERFMLAEYLPGMDQETFGRTLKELFSAQNFHFGSPLETLFSQLKGGLLDPDIVLYRHGLIFLKRREHYQCLCKYHNSMVWNLAGIKDAWQNYAVYDVEERLQLLNVMRNQRPLRYERNGNFGSDTDIESAETWKLNKQFKMRQRFAKPSFDGMPRGIDMGQDMVKFGKEYSKGVLKVAASKVLAQENGGTSSRYSSASKYGTDSKASVAMQHLALPHQSEFAGYDVRAAKRSRHTVSGDNDNLDEWYVGSQGWVAGHRSAGGMNSLLKLGKKQKLQKRYDISMYSDEDVKVYSGFTRAHGKITNADQVVTVASNGRESSGHTKKAKYFERDWVYLTAGQAQDSMLTLSMQQSKLHEEAISSGHLVKPDDWTSRAKRSKVRIMYKADKSGAVYDLENKYYQPVSTEMGDTSLHNEPRARILQGQRKNNLTRYKGLGVDHSRGTTKISQNEETESDSSDQAEDDGDCSPSRNWRHQSDGVGGKYCGVVRSRYDSKEPNKLMKVDIEGYSDFSDVGRSRHSPDVESYSATEKHGRLVKKGLLPHQGEKLVCTEKKHKRMVDHSPQHSFKPKRKINSHYPNVADEFPHLESRPKQQMDDANAISKHKKKEDDEIDTSTVITPDMVISEQDIRDVDPKEKPQRKPSVLITPAIHTGFSFSIIHLLSAVRKAMITPHMEDVTMIVNNLEKDESRPQQMPKEQNKLHQVANGTHVSHSLEHLDKHTSKFAGHKDLPSLTVQQIVNRVRSNPGDPCILETREPLQDLVWGVLKIFSSKTAPLGAKSWKPLVLYEKSDRSWYWVGPVAPSSFDNNNAEEESSSEAWGIPHKMLVKLVDAFANWLIIGQETLRQIGNLPPRPTSLHLNLDEKDRFKGLRAQKSLNTISPSSVEVREYFRREEFLRYSVPDRAFFYTAADGKKSIVAPLRRGGGKPTSKARGHFMLKHNRPPHITILCLVRDAAARLPGSIGTRADVCTLLRDSQYIVDQVSDVQMNQVVSGALDRLHYERDPCVQFDNERKLWVYLHRDREEEDFEDDGTSSTKKWKRQKKDSIDQSGTGTVNDVDTGASAVGGSSALPYHDYDLNVDISSIRTGGNAELVSY
ncbi:hypothetical protein C4D60_Mb10t27840 [Musa balbisiana]|uniref:DEUBAD domain-containing protein n=1 Tax=Musa balbisiana TaxID=52838 RepID=A0A4S8J1S2_MUSBA|nr:hypothetical protein C4D60_Mb10t27840 [Musa balbisiana]